MKARLRLRLVLASNSVEGRGIERGIVNLAWGFNGIRLASQLRPFSRWARLWSLVQNADLGSVMAAHGLEKASEFSHVKVALRYEGLF